MWAIRRTSSIAIKSRTFSAITFCLEHELSGCNIVDKTSFSKPLPHSYTGSPFLKRDLFTSKHVYSSLAGTKSSGEEVDDELLDDEADHSEDVVEVHENTETSDAVKNTRKEKRRFSALFHAIMDSPTLPVEKALDKWLEKGDKITDSDVYSTMNELRRRKLFGKAFQLSEWLESRNQIEFSERDYASRVDLISKTRGLQAAENYIEKIPESFRTEVIYRTLLSNAVQSGLTTKAEQIFKKMKDSKFPISTFACNQLILLYKRTNKEKIPDIMSFMEQENIKPSSFTFGALIDIKGKSNDINGMEKIIETMKAENIEPDSNIQFLLAKNYIYGGLKEKAFQVLKEIQGNNPKENRWVFPKIFSLYAEIGSFDDVKRLWEFCKPNPRFDECVNAINAFGKLEKVEEAEAVFDQMSTRFKTIPSIGFTAMVQVYANNKMLSEGKELVKKMAESGCKIGPLTWDALIKLYVEAGEIEKAGSILRRAFEQKKQGKLLFETYMRFMDEYSRKGDVHNAEKVFHWMRQDGYVSRPTQYHSLLRTYVNAKVPAYGFRERMKADKVTVNHSFAGELARVDPFKRNVVADMLD